MRSGPGWMRSGPGENREKLRETANSQQPTANSQQPTANPQHPKIMKKASPYRVAVRSRVKPSSRNPPHPNGLRWIPKSPIAKNWQPSNPSFRKCLSRKTPRVSKVPRRNRARTKRKCLGRLVVEGGPVAKCHRTVANGGRAALAATGGGVMLQSAGIKQM
jgi:hypothetical protein